MKRLILGIGALVLFSTSIYAAKIAYQTQNGDSILYGITCSNGKSITIHYYPNGSRYYDGNNGNWSSLQEAMNNSCKESQNKNNSSKTGRTLNLAMFCPKKSLMEKALGSDMTYYLSDSKERFTGERWKNCKHMKSVRIEIINEFKGKIDNYYSVKFIGYNPIYYIRKSLVKIE